ncbi:SRPBCC family protein [Lysobacter sp. CA196]|uniref:SRPBCC family protein n=1 Tax=Lysobacter sp. CA196 TaxID=3455606 RepID=UPI003F8D19E7
MAGQNEHTRDTEQSFPDPVTKTVQIQAEPATVWQALTEPARMAAWMSEEPLDVVTDWVVGGPILIRGVLHGRLRFENSGIVRAFETERALEYTHWSSLSRRALADAPENHVSIGLRLHPSGDGTRLDLSLSNLGHYAVYGHMNFYWEVTLAVLKRYCEAEAR